jgi:hypothetical protein
MSAPPGYLKDYVREVWRASYRALEITDTLVVAAIVVIGAAGSFLEHLHGHPPWWLIAYALALLVFYGTFLRAPYRLYVRERKARENLERRLTPRLVVRPPEIATSSHGGPSAAYVRVPVSNESDEVARCCSARLIKIEVKDTRGIRELPYHDTLDLGWSNKPPGTRELDIRPHLTEWFDVVVTEQGQRCLTLATIVRPNTYESLMTIAGTYRFTIELASDGGGAHIFQVNVDYGMSLRSLAIPNNGALVILGRAPY